MNIGALGHLGPLVGLTELTERVFAYLQETTGLRTWVMSRVAGDRWTVLVVNDDRQYGLEPGTSFAWTDTLCHRMVERHGSTIARDVANDDVYGSAPIRDRLAIGAYVGLPVPDGHGGLFGTVCAFDPDPQPEALVGQAESIALVVAMLTAQLQTELRLLDEVRRADNALALASADPVTHLINRRGLEALLEREEARCQRYGNAASLIAVTLPTTAEPDDARALSTTRVLNDRCRTTDAVARTGDDDFVVFLAEADARGAAMVAARIRHDLRRLGIVDSRVTTASRPPRVTLQNALRAAESDLSVLEAESAAGHAAS